MFAASRIAVVSLGAALFVCPGVEVSADIYRYQDTDGVWHFTNIKRHNRFKLFMRTPRKSPSAYIKAYHELIHQASRQYGVDPSLIKAVIRAESGFDHKAVSHKGAQGLMQLMPDTANKMEVDDPFDPEENIFGGTRYLSLLLKRFNNDKRLALAAYNAGPEKVAHHNGVPPIPETESYVRKVLEYYEGFDATDD
jgi:soluble lytic murein transglycosylase